MSATAGGRGARLRELREGEIAISDAALLVLPKPIFGWTIVDAIRLHAQALAPAEAQ